MTINKNLKFGVLASGNLGFSTVASLWDRGLRPVFLFTDKGSQALHAFAGEQQIPLYVGNPRNHKGYEMLRKARLAPDLILSINYIFLLDEEMITLPCLGCVNFHGSLLPRYRGRSPHIWAIINNEKKTGITAHYIDSGCDTGRIISQQEIPIARNATGADILLLYSKAYPDFVEQTLRLFMDGLPPSGKAQDESKATYFGKRVPEDGLINWNWHRERIYNWVRALADPYPGSFAFYDNQKLVIDKIEFAENGFSYEIENGTVLEGGSTPVIKTPNGAIRITAYRSNILLKEGKILK